jgi:PIN domain nuclease of toxin-antitoxin system
MRLLLDTHVLLWAASTPEKLGEKWRARLENPENELLFSAASFWEIAAKKRLERDDLKVDMWFLRRRLIENEYLELPVTSEHTCFTQVLENLHHDPFDRLLIAQACVDNVILVTADPLIAQYSGPIEVVTTKN